MQPQWTPELHHMWPQRFRDVVRLLLLACSCAGVAAGDTSTAVDAAAAPAECSSGAGAPLFPALPLSRDTVLEVVAAAAYPVSAWL